MKIIYSGEKIENCAKSIFLAGPVPRDKSVKSWRDEALQYLEKHHFSGIIFNPECRVFDNIEGNYDYMEWDKKAIESCTAILMWIPRNMKDMPALTSNIEFGLYLHSGKLFYGRPDESPFNTYLDWLYKRELKKRPINDLEQLIVKVIEFLK